MKCNQSKRTEQILQRFACFSLCVYKIHLKGRAPVLTKSLWILFSDCKTQKVLGFWAKCWKRKWNTAMVYFQVQHLNSLLYWKWVNGGLMFGLRYCVCDVNVRLPWWLLLLKTVNILSLCLSVTIIAVNVVVSSVILFVCSFCIVCVQYLPTASPL